MDSYSGVNYPLAIPIDPQRSGTSWLPPHLYIDLVWLGLGWSSTHCHHCCELRPQPSCVPRTLFHCGHQLPPQSQTSLALTVLPPTLPRCPLSPWGEGGDTDISFRFDHFHSANFINIAKCLPSCYPWFFWHKCEKDSVCIRAFPEGFWIARFGQDDEFKAQATEAVPS